MKNYYLFTILALLFTPAAFSFAQSACGTITSPIDIFDLESQVETRPIIDCGNPFGVTNEVVNPYTLTIEGTVVSDGAEVVVEEGTRSYVVSGRLFPYDSIHSFYRHEDQDYVYFDVSPSTPTEGEYRNFAESYFPEGTDVEPFVQAAVSGENEDLTISQQNQFYEFLEFVNEHYDSQKPLLTPGTYTLVSQSYELTVSDAGVLNWFRNLIVPTAHAQFLPDLFHTITFEIVEQEPEPQGASSVLFLPGIQASRLYKEGLFGTEDRLWEPTTLFSQDVEQLGMNANGTSINDVYTRDVLDTAPGVGGVYIGFLGFLEKLKSEENLIDDYRAFAYDWRYNVFDVAKNGTQYEDDVIKPDEIVRELASGSRSGKVTIVAHSNGGLLAKALFIEHPDLADKVDQIIFIGTPQLGTPKAIGTILHGYDQSVDILGGIPVIGAAAAREVINNLPGVYSLLPSIRYFDDLTHPMVSFSNEVATAPYRAEYGSELSTFDDYLDFLSADDSLDRDLDSPVSVPGVTNQIMLLRAMAQHRDQLDTWTAPDSVKVVEIVGTGLPTMKSILYRDIFEDECEQPQNPDTSPQCNPQNEMKPYAMLTKYGDGTVVQKSASAYDNDKVTRFLNLAAVRSDMPGSNFEHLNLTEFPEVLDLFREQITDLPSSYDYLSDIPYTFDDSSYDIEMIDSPVRMLVQDGEGRRTGVVIVDSERRILNEIPNSNYFEFADTKYVVLPSDIDRTTYLYGEGYGGYTLTIAKLANDDEQTVEATMRNASATPQMVATYEKTEGVYSTIETDLDGDAEIDLVTNLSGVVVNEPVTYALLRERIQELQLKPKQEKVLLALLKQAEALSLKPHRGALQRKLEKGLLVATKVLILHHKQSGVIASGDADKLIGMIETLVKES